MSEYADGGKLKARHNGASPQRMEALVRLYFFWLTIRVPDHRTAYSEGIHTMASTIGRYGTKSLSTRI